MKEHQSKPFSEVFYPLDIVSNRELSCFTFVTLPNQEIEHAPFSTLGHAEEYNVILREYK